MRVLLVCLYGLLSMSVWGTTAMPQSRDFLSYVKKTSAQVFHKRESVLMTYAKTFSHMPQKPAAILYYGDAQDAGFFHTLVQFAKARQQTSHFCTQWDCPFDAQFVDASSIMQIPAGKPAAKSAKQAQHYGLIVDAKSSFDQQGLSVFLQQFSRLQPGGIYLIELQDFSQYHQHVDYLARAILTQDRRNTATVTGVWSFFKRLMGYTSYKFTPEQTQLFRWIESIRLVDDCIIIEKRKQVRPLHTSLVAKSSEGLRYQVCADPVTAYFGASLSTRLHDLHQQLFTGEYDFCSELPEQLMHLHSIRPGDRVLELGANIGRGTLIIASQVGPKGHVTASEISPDDRATLARFLKINRLEKRVSIVPAIGKHPFIYRGWDSQVWPHDATVPLPKGWKLAPAIDLPAVRHNVLVADCEGCLLPLIEQYPHILDGVEKIIIENDASDAATAKLAALFQARGFQSKLCVPIENRARNKRSNYSKSCFYQIWIQS